MIGSRNSLTPSKRERGGDHGESRGELLGRPGHIGPWVGGIVGKSGRHEKGIPGKSIHDAQVCEVLGVLE